VRDVSHEDAEAQLVDVENILRQLGIDTHDVNDRHTMIEVWNKIDRLDAQARARLQNLADRRPEESRPVLVSAITGQGLERLAAAIEARLAAGRTVIALELEAEDGAGVSWLHRHTEVISKTVDQQTGRVAMTVRTDPARANEVREKFAQ
jgi:GTP-binding protein HflX